MHKLLLIVAMVCLLAGCAKTSERPANDSRVIKPIDQAEDGTVLWRKFDVQSNKYVYFTSQGIEKVLPE